nr:hypothetical protein [Pantoea cypripedii]
MDSPQYERRWVFAVTGMGWGMNPSRFSAFGIAWNGEGQNKNAPKKLISEATYRYGNLSNMR